MAKPSVLISVRDPADAFALARMFTDAGLSAIADTSARVVELASRYCPSLIVLDVEQGRAGGAELLSELRRNLATRGVRIIVVSSFDDEKARAAAASVGALAFAVKPFDCAFVRAIAALVRATEAAVAAASA